MVLAVSCKKDDAKNKIVAPEAVDLGLVVNGKNVKWGSFNIGASKEYELGNYYAWGECEPKEEYTWDSYIHAGSRDHITKYCPDTESGKSYWDFDAMPDGPDGKLFLWRADDVAKAKLGGNWRMPTWDEYIALLDLKDNPDYKWENRVSVVNAKGKAVYGMRITRLSTDASVFFPTAGFAEDEQIGEDVGEQGCYWSSSLNNDSPLKAGFLAVKVGLSFMASESRAIGFSVRPVYVESETE